MAKTTAPLLSFGAAGQIAKSMVMSSWRGVPYARRYVIPANPRTQEQQLTRGVFAVLQQVYALMPPQVTAAFELYATGRPFIGRNAFTSVNLRNMRENDATETMEGLIVSPGARGGLPAQAIAASVAGADIDVTFQLPTIPDGWTLDTAIAVAFIDQDPTQAFNQPILVAQAGTPDYSPVISTDEPGDYIVAGFLQWTKPNGDTAYSRSLATTATVA